MEKNIFGERLKQERNRLGLTQEAFAAIGGVKKLAQINYEQGKTLPDAGYLTALSGVGVDIVFVMFGIPASDTLSDDEKELLVCYRKLDVRSKARVLGVVEGIGAPEGASASKPHADPTSRTVVFEGTVGQQVTGDVTGKQTFNFGNRKK